MNKHYVLVAEDDLEDQEILREALLETCIDSAAEFVMDGEALIKTLVLSTDHLPDLILLDLNMPKKNGWETLKELRAHDVFRHIPVVIFTTSQSAEDVTEVYSRGANSFIRKPSTFGDTVSILKATMLYWFSVVDLPCILGSHRRPKSQ